ncbi:MAG: UDP-N-acetylenolpyruvoylglucosamine reductase [Clostridia bacterium 62_21]|nr:MAG: UDP-N-acetylenolpyruvoylglucosamine reductase [Clostridia bacterium 62_21]
MNRQQAIIADLKYLLQGNVLADEPLSMHTTWRVGGPAEVFVMPVSSQDVAAVTRYANERGIPLTVLGNGSNVLVGDRGLAGIVLKIGAGLAQLDVKRNKIRAQAGAGVGRVAAAALEAHLGGLEFVWGIPASIGGAIVMNAGANGRAMADVVTGILAVTPAGETATLGREDLVFGYRESILQATPLIVVEALLTLAPREKDRIRREMEAGLAHRKATQPLAYPSAGSVFKNPPGQAAGRLIELAGAKGLTVGKAQVSRKHANFIINLGGATAADIYELINRVRELVYEKTGISLELEVKVLGEM